MTPNKSYLIEVRGLKLNNMTVEEREATSYLIEVRGLKHRTCV